MKFLANKCLIHLNQASFTILIFALINNDSNYRC
jgi:hypothetical protein